MKRQPSVKSIGDFPYALVRKYGDPAKPKYLKDLNEARREVQDDIADLLAEFGRFLTQDDKARLDEFSRVTVQLSINRWIDRDQPLEYDVLVDEYSGLRYGAKVTQR